MENVLKNGKYTGVYDSIRNSLLIRSNGFFSVLQGKMSVPQKPSASQRFCAPERATVASGAQFIQACNITANRMISWSKNLLFLLEQYNSIGKKL